MQKNNNIRRSGALRALAQPPEIPTNIEGSNIMMGLVLSTCKLGGVSTVVNPKCHLALFRRFELAS